MNFMCDKKSIRKPEPDPEPYTDVLHRRWKKKKPESEAGSEFIEENFR